MTSIIENSKIRRIILVEHEGLRIGLRSIETLLDRVAGGDLDAVQNAHQQFQNLLQSFIRHIEHEERILRPVLEKVDAWGPARVKSMDDEHTEQRATVQRLARLEALSDPTSWAKAVRTFTAELLTDMAGEEKTCLSPNVLRDDVVAIEGDSE